MKKLFAAAVCLGILFTAACARADSGWLTDFNQAKSQAAAKNLPILADFTGSDWCVWCKKLDSEVLSKPAFQTFAKTHCILFMADFPNGKKLPPATAAQNNALLKQYGVQGFPTILLLDANGNVIAKTGYKPGGPDAYVTHLKGLLKIK